MEQNKIIIEKPLLYTIEEVATLLHTSTEFVYSLKESKLLPFIKLESYQVRHEALIEFLKTFEGFDITNPNHVRKI